MPWERDLTDVWPVPPRRWRIIRSWCNPAGLTPRRDVQVWCHMGTGECRWVIVGANVMVASGVCSHPVQWEHEGAMEWEVMAQFVRRVVEKAVRHQKALDSAAEEWVQTYPALWEYLSLEVHDDGTVRERSMLMCLVEDGLFKACLQDRDQGQSLWVSGTALPGALAALEAHLAAGTGEWRQMKQQGQRKQNQKGVK